MVLRLGDGGGIGRGFEKELRGWTDLWRYYRKKTDISVWHRDRSGLRGRLKRLWVFWCCIATTFCLGEDMLCVRLSQIIDSETSPRLNALMFTCLFT